MVKNKHGIFTSYIWYAKLLHKQDLYWVTSNEEFAIKAVLWRDVQQSRGRLAEDFVKVRSESSCFIFLDAPCSHRTYNFILW